MTEKRDPFGIREGEVSAPLPEQPDASLYFIGRIRTPWKERKDCPKNARESREGGVVCTIELDPRWAPALKDIETCTHLVVLYWMDRSRRDLVVQVPGHYKAGRGTFALRSPVRPNPIAMSVVKLVKVEGTTLSVIGVDCLDGTPLLDLKPYFAVRRLHPGRGGGLARRAQKLAPIALNLFPSPRDQSQHRTYPCATRIAGREPMPGRRHICRSERKPGPFVVLSIGALERV